MSRLTRVYQAVFGDTGAQSHFEQFGSRALGASLRTKDPATIQGLSAFTVNGWLDAINGANKAPFLEDMNGLHYLIFRQLAYLLQDGIPDYDPTTPYYTGSIVRKSGTFEQYGSLSDNNVGNALPSQTNNAYWQYLNPASEAPGVVKDFAGPSAPFGYLLCDGTPYAQASYPALYSSIGTNWNTFRGASDPGGSLFRVPDLRGLTRIGVGHGPGLANNYSLASFIGEETHTLTISELAAHSHGVNDTGHSHQINNNSNSAAGSGKVTVGGDSSEGSAPSTDNAGTGITIQNTGSGTPHNNMQPSVALTPIIKY